MRNKLENLKESILNSLENAHIMEDINELKVKALGKKSEINQLMKNMATMLPDEKKEFGMIINQTKKEIQDAIDLYANKLKEKIKREKLEKESIDISLPGRKATYGTLHPITKTMMEIKNIVSEYSFDIVDGPELELVKYNFDALNIDESHPSREKTDTFYITPSILLRTQTSPMQIRYMLDNKPPFRMISLGKVYRPDYDVSHTPMFHQVEGLVVGENISFANFKAMLELIVKRIFGKERKVRFRPHFFPFTEPSAEMDVECGTCSGQGCRICKYTGWLEILGSGMVNDKVLEAGGIDPVKYNGFAFGIGLERVTMLKYGIDDLRAFFENDIRFLEQF